MLRHTLPSGSNGERGRPRFEIPSAQLEFFVEKGFKFDEIAQLFVTSPSAVERRLAEFGLSIRTTEAQLLDSDLDATVTEIMSLMLAVKE